MVQITRICYPDVSYRKQIYFQDVYGSGGSLSDADRMALAIISYVGCGVSFIAMCLTLITFLTFKYVVFHLSYVWYTALAASFENMFYEYRYANKMAEWRNG